MRFSNIDQVYAWAKARGIPLDASFDLTYRCNVRCVHCLNRPVKDKELTFKEVISVMDQLAKAGTLFLKFGGGEPFVRKDFFDIALHARKRGFAIGLYTNATLITKKVAKRIEELHPWKVSVSLYGASEEGYGKATGVPNAFQKAKEGLRFLSEVDIPLQVGVSVLGCHSAADLLWMRDYCARLGVEGGFYETMLPGKNGDCSALRHAPDEAQWAELFKEIPEGLVEPAPVVKDVLACESLGTRIYIDPYGYVGNCSSLACQENIRNKPLLKIWKENPLLKRLRSLKRKSLTECMKCDIRDYCSPCPGINYSATGYFSRPPKGYCSARALVKKCHKKFLRTRP